MPVVLLDEMVLEWSRVGLPAVNDVLAHYNDEGNSKTQLLYPLSFRFPLLAGRT